MIEVEIDGKKVQVAQGTMIIEAADILGVYIPRFCYHRKLSVVASCRMCLVELEKSKKPVPACATPVTTGMVVSTVSPMVKEAQNAVMEFLLINHPLDCPICDQGGECELQDLSLAYGKDSSKFYEGKRAVANQDIGPLVSTEMTRCIQCSRCVRFGDEIAGVRELGLVNRGDHVEVKTYLQKSLVSEVSGNVIDLCPVGALTSKPFRFRARSWELNESFAISPHDCLGSNLAIHTRLQPYKKSAEVMRVVPKDCESINETWLSDRDRFSYEGINHSSRLTKPMIKLNGEWREVSWIEALQNIQLRLAKILEKEDNNRIGFVISPQSTLEEHYLLQKLARSLGVNNIDHRIRDLDFSQQESVEIYPNFPLLLEEIEDFNNIVLLGSNIRHEQPIAALRVRKAALSGSSILALNSVDFTLNFPLLHKKIISPAEMPIFLSQIVKTLACKVENINLEVKEKLDKFLLLNDDYPLIPEVNAWVDHLINSEKTVFFVGETIQHHPQAGLMYYLVEIISGLLDAKVGHFTDSCNSSGAWLAGTVPHRGPAGRSVPCGLNVQEMWNNKLSAYFLWNFEPAYDCTNVSIVHSALKEANLVVVATSYDSPELREYSNIMLPLSPFSEMAGTYVNVEGMWQSFKAATIPLEESKPGWKILRALANILGFENGFQYEHSGEVLNELRTVLAIHCVSSSNWHGVLNKKYEKGLWRLGLWPIYRVDPLVRRAHSLQEMQNILSSEQNAVMINPQTAKLLDLVEGEEIEVKQENSDWYKVKIAYDHSVATDTLFLPAGLLIHKNLGPAIGPIEYRKL